LPGHPLGPPGAIPGLAAPHPAAAGFPQGPFPPAGAHPGFLGTLLLLLLPTVIVICVFVCSTRLISLLLSS
jgi:hypothetical protein